MMTGEKYIWIIWNVNCAIAKSKEKDFEKYLNDHEEYLIPKFIKYMADYAKFREEEMDHKFKFKILREVKFRIQEILL